MTEEKNKVRFDFKDTKRINGGCIASNHWRKPESKYEELTSSKYSLTKYTDLS